MTSATESAGPRLRHQTSRPAGEQAHTQPSSSGPSIWKRAVCSGSSVIPGQWAARGSPVKRTGAGRVEWTMIKTSVTVRVPKERVRDYMSAIATSMLDINHFKIGALRDTPPGSLFVPAVAGGDHFLSGRLNDFPVLVVLGGESPFSVGSPEEWSRTSGLIVNVIEFEVDPTTALRIRDPEDAPHGALVLSSRGPMIIAHDHNGTKAVLLAGGEGPTYFEGDMAVAFTAWHVVAGTGAKARSLFKFPLPSV